MFSFEAHIPRLVHHTGPLVPRDSTSPSRTDTLGAAEMNLGQWYRYVQQGFLLTYIFSASPSGQLTMINTGMFGTSHLHSADSVTAHSPEHHQHDEVWSC